MRVLYWLLAIMELFVWLLAVMLVTRAVGAWGLRGWLALVPAALVFSLARHAVRWARRRSHPGDSDGDTQVQEEPEDGPD